MKKLFAADFTWNQTDWDGGVSNSTVTEMVNTYQSASGVSVANNGEIALDLAYKTAMLRGNQLFDESFNFNNPTSKSLSFNLEQEYDENTFNYNSNNPTQLTVNSAGDYLISLTMILNSNAIDRGHREAVEAEIRINGVKKSVGVARSSYQRTDSNHTQSSNHLAVLLEDLNAGDYIEIVAGGYAYFANNLTGEFTVYVEKIENSENVFSATGTRTIAGIDLNDSTESSMQWNQGRVDIGYSHSDTVNGHEILIEETGNYLVLVNIPLAGSPQRGSVVGRVKLAGSTVTGGEFRQGYLRNYDSHNKSSIHWSGVVSASIGEKLTIDVTQDAANGTITTGGEQATLFLQKLPEKGIFYASATQVGESNNWNPSTKSSINWSAVEIKDSSVYSHNELINNDQIEVLVGGDYVIGVNANYYCASSMRQNPKINIQVNGVDVSGAESSTGYIRNSGNHNKSSETLYFPVNNVNAGDLITVSVQATTTNNAVDDEVPSILMIWKKGYKDQGVLTSNVFDAGLASDWEELVYNYSGLGYVGVRGRTANKFEDINANPWSSCSVIINESFLSENDCVNNGDRYFQYQVILEPDLGQTPIFEDVSIGYSYSDETPPPDNATNVVISGVDNGEWTNREPLISWSAGADNLTGSGVLGYCVALDEVVVDSESSTLDPVLTAGNLLSFLDDGVDMEACDFIVEGNFLDLSSIIGLNLRSGKQYYFSLKTIDRAGNVWVGNSENYQDLVSFKYDNVKPENPDFISLPGDFVSNKAITVFWPTSNSQGPTDDASGVAGMQYKIGSNGVWYGASHTGTQDLTDLLIHSSGSYTMNEINDYPLIKDGSNMIYFRTWDYAGNFSDFTVSGAIKVNTTAPSTPINLMVTPEENTLNSFAFSWETPANYTGQESNLRYCYTINTLPNLNTCNLTENGAVSLSEDSYATQPGVNTFYLVAKDEAGNINYDTYAMINFNANTSAPGIPSSIDIADVSVKATSSWKLAISWEEPEVVGAGISSYKIYHSTNNLDYELESTVTGISYVDVSLDQKVHYYKIKACDSANNCGAFTEPVSLYPDGKFIAPPELMGNPSVSSVTTKRATISWSTDRTSDSKVAYGKKSGDYYDEEPSNSEQVVSHKISLVSLDPGTKYYYKSKWTDEDGNTGESEEKTFVTANAPTVSEVKTTTIGIDFATIEFKTKGSSRAKIYYGQSTDFGGVKELVTSTEEASYAITLTGLQDGVKYYYRINTFDSENDEYSGTILDFSTLPRPRISDVKIQQVKGTAQSTILINWLTNTETSSIVTYYPNDSPELARDEVSITLEKGSHRMLLRGLLPQRKYSLIVKGRDKAGNEAESDVYSFDTAMDTRPPQISDLSIEGSNIKMSGREGTNSSQLVISWNTDEPATSQVEYGEGTGSGYSQKTGEDAKLTHNHLVVISGLTPSKVYHLRTISKDEAGNESRSIDNVTITPKATDNALDLVITSLREVFGFIGK